MTESNPFAVEWQECLRAHYAHVVHEKDFNNEKSLITVLYDTGFSEQDVHEMRAALVGDMETDTDDEAYRDVEAEAFVEEEAAPIVEEIAEAVEAPILIEELPEIEAVAEMEPAEETIDNVTPEAVVAEEAPETQVAMLIDSAIDAASETMAASIGESEPETPAKPAKAAKAAKTTKVEKIDPPAENPTQMSLF